MNEQKCAICTLPAIRFPRDATFIPLGGRYAGHRVHTLCFRKVFRGIPTTKGSRYRKPIDDSNWWHIEPNDKV